MAEVSDCSDDGPPIERVGLNALFVVPKKVGGTETYVRAIVRGLSSQAQQTSFVVYCGVEFAADLAQTRLTPNVIVRRVPLPMRVKPLRIAAELLLLPLLARRDRVEVLHSLGTTAPLWSRAARVVTVHDLIFHHFPETFPLLARAALELLVPAAARRSDVVIADSHATADDLARSYGIDRSRVDVIHLGLGSQVNETKTPTPQLRERYSLPRAPLVFCVSALLAHKNIARLIASFAQVQTDATLVIAGHEGRELDALRQHALRIGVANRVRFTGWVSAADLERLYALATCFVYPSLFEGFGLPPLEAMRRGVPVACSNATSLPEVVGDAAITFDPLDEHAIATAIDRLLTDDNLRAELIARGRERAAAFTWEKTAQETLAAYERALQAHHA